MKKILFILLFAPFMLSAQIPAPLVDLSKYHDDNRIKEMTDLNFTNITEGGYQIPSITADAITATTATITTADIDSATIVHLNYSPPHGAMNFADSATVIALTQNVWVKMTGPGGDLFVIRDQDDITIDGDSITIEVPGDYLTWVAFSFDGIQSAEFHIALYKNGVITDWEFHRKTSAQDTGNAGMPAYVEGLVAGDDLSIWIENTGNSGDATMISGQWIITMLHPD